EPGELGLAARGHPRGCVLSATGPARRLARRRGPVLGARGRLRGGPGTGAATGRHALDQSQDPEQAAQREGAPEELGREAAADHGPADRGWKEGPGSIAPGR